MRCIIISIGDELLIGQTVNTNAAEIGQMLTAAGASVERTIAIGDEEPIIEQTLAASLGEYDVILTTGGLGPTKDDITKTVVARVVGCDLEFSQPAFDHLSKMLGQFGREPTPSHREQCFLPTRADLMHNAVGTAPGMHFALGTTHLFVLPGVPYEMRYLMEHGVIPRIEDAMPGIGKRLYHTFSTVGEGESRLALKLEDLEDNLPDHLGIAYLPAPGRVRIRVAGRIDSPAHEQDFASLRDRIRQRLKDYIFSEEDIPLSKAVGNLLRSQGAMLSVAESCTGGYTGHLITAVPGSSDYFSGGAITYSNALKMSVLGVKEATLLEHGAVSSETALEMARGAAEAFKTDYALAITGVAGPGGGSDTKPVGTVWIAVAGPFGAKARKFQFTKNRAINIELSATAALNMVRKVLMRTP